MTVKVIPCPGDMLCQVEDCDEPTAVALVDDRGHSPAHEGEGMTTSFGACAVCWAGVAACARHAPTVLEQVRGGA